MCQEILKRCADIFLYKVNSDPRFLAPFLRSGCQKIAPRHLPTGPSRNRLKLVLYRPDSTLLKSLSARFNTRSRFIKSMKLQTIPHLAYTPLFFPISFQQINYGGGLWLSSRVRIGNKTGSAGPANVYLCARRSHEYFSAGSREICWKTKLFLTS